MLENKTEEESLLAERYVLARQRLCSMTQETVLPPTLSDYFSQMAGFLCEMCAVGEQIKEGSYFEKDEQMLAAENEKLFWDVLPKQYEESFANPAYAVKRFGKKNGRLLSFVYAQLRSVIPAVFEQKTEELVIHMELLIELYGAAVCICEESIEAAGNSQQAAETQGTAGGSQQEAEASEAATSSQQQKLYAALHEIVYYFVHDYAEDMTLVRVREKLDPQADFAYRIIMESDLDDIRYLYRYGEYISENQLGTARFLAKLPDETIRLMADTYTEGYRIGFVKGNKDLSKKKVAQIVCPIGFERMIRAAIENFKEMGLAVTIMRTPHSIFTKRGMALGGFYSESPNRQYEYDHREDEALFLDKKLVNRKLEVQKEAYEACRTLAKEHAGPAWVEVFGEKPFVPQAKEEACRLSEKQQEMSTSYYGQLGRLIDQYVPGEERSFTIIAFPIPEIGADYEAIMQDTIALNTLDYQTYETIQQKMIDALDEACYVKIEGRGDNRTNLKVMLTQLENPSKQTKFENCVADVNIPVGEVFTSPQLAGTCGTLHVSHVFLNGLGYKDLEISFTDGRITSYSCANFADEQEGKKLLKENVLYHHRTLPMGEFAIGTNTTAYVMGRKYGIEDRMPILIAEKCGPHFAVGDTCYSHAEEVAVYNPDGKEIIARDNEISLLRKTEIEKAYFQCHTDITIPYDELGRLYGVKEDGTQIPVIENGRFVLPGTEELNHPLDDHYK